MTAEDDRGHRVGQILIGILFMLFGTLLMLDRSGIIEVGNIWQYTAPLVLIGLGVSRLLGWRRHDRSKGGLWLLMIGVWLLVNQLRIVRWRDSWPLLLVAVGISILWDVVVKPPAPSATRED